MNEEPIQYICAICDTPMDEKGKCEKCKPISDFKPSNFWAFMTLSMHLRYKATGRKDLQISQKLLDEFDPEDAPKIRWDPHTDSWVMEIDEEETPLIFVPAGPPKRQRRRKRII